MLTPAQIAFLLELMHTPNLAFTLDKCALAASTLATLEAAAKTSSAPPTPPPTS